MELLYHTLVAVMSFALVYLIDKKTGYISKVLTKNLRVKAIIFIVIYSIIRFAFIDAFATNDVLAYINKAVLGIFIGFCFIAGNKERSSS